MKTINILLISFFTLLVSCGQDSGAAPSSSSSVKKIFLSATSHNGNLGGATGADSICAVDANLPAGGGTYKALIADTSRQAPSTDWPLAASTTYYRSDGTTVIGTTTSGRVFSFPLTNSVSTLVLDTWTGLLSSWTLDSSYNCSNWTSNSNGVQARLGYSNRTNDVSIDQISVRACDSASRLYCVEQ